MSTCTSFFLSLAFNTNQTQAFQQKGNQRIVSGHISHRNHLQRSTWTSRYQVHPNTDQKARRLSLWRIRAYFFFFFFCLRLLTFCFVGGIGDEIQEDKFLTQTTHIWTLSKKAQAPIFPLWCHLHEQWLVSGKRGPVSVELGHSFQFCFCFSLGLHFTTWRRNMAGLITCDKCMCYRTWETSANFVFAAWLSILSSLSCCPRCTPCSWSLQICVTPVFCLLLEDPSRSVALAMVEIMAVSHRRHGTEFQFWGWTESSWCGLFILFLPWSGYATRTTHWCSWLISFFLWFRVLWRKTCFAACLCRKTTFNLQRVIHSLLRPPVQKDHTVRMVASRALTELDCLLDGIFLGHELQEEPNTLFPASWSVQS